VTGSGFIAAMTLACVAINWFYFLMLLVVRSFCPSGLSGVFRVVGGAIRFVCARGSGLESRCEIWIVHPSKNVICRKKERKYF
jgi:hypothetical protein